MYKSAELTKGQIGLDFSLKLKFTEKVETYKKRIGSWNKPSYTTAKRTVREYQGGEGLIDECMWKIANAMKDNMYIHSPVDERKNKDKIVLRENIGIEQRGIGKYRVGPQGIVYALRRNFENKKNPNKKHYIEKTWNFHTDEYQEILNKYAEDIGTDIIRKAIRGLTGAKDKNFEIEKFVNKGGKFNFNDNF